MSLLSKRNLKARISSKEATRPSVLEISEIHVSKIVAETWLINVGCTCCCYHQSLAACYPGSSSTGNLLSNSRLGSIFHKTKVGEMAFQMARKWAHMTDSLLDFSKSLLHSSWLVRLPFLVQALHLLEDKKVCKFSGLLEAILYLTTVLKTNFMPEVSSESRVSRSTLHISFASLIAEGPIPCLLSESTCNVSCQS